MISSPSPDDTCELDTNRKAQELDTVGLFLIFMTRSKSYDLLKRVTSRVHGCSRTYLVTSVSDSPSASLIVFPWSLRSVQAIMSRETLKIQLWYAPVIRRSRSSIHAYRHSVSFIMSALRRRLLILPPVIGRDVVMSSCPRNLPAMRCYFT